MPEIFIKSLKNSPKKNDVFNPWWEFDEYHDISKEAPNIRRRQLYYYLHERIKHTKYLLVGEAIGYQGGHFTGIPMTSERILLGGHVKKGIFPEHVFSWIKPKRTSKTDLKPQGFTEPTGTIVWGHIIQSNLNPRDFILWNAFPWHPFKPDIGFLSNRTPDDGELQSGAGVLAELIPESIKIRHPANGGATIFKKHFDSAIRKIN